MTRLDEMELRSTIARQENVICTMENDLRKAERENRELQEKLAAIDTSREWANLTEQLLGVLGTSDNICHECNTMTTAPELYESLKMSMFAVGLLMVRLAPQSDLIEKLKGWCERCCVILMKARGEE